MRLFLPLTCLVLGCSLLVSLGFWQLSRGEEKDKRVILFEERVGIKARQLGVDSLSRNVENLVWRRIEFSGIFLMDLFFLDNRIKNSKAGYDVLVPFQVTNGPLVLVCLGWVASGNNRDILPKVAVVGAGNKVSGIFAPVPFSGLDFMSPITTFEDMGNNRFRMQRIDLDALNMKLNNKIFPLVVHLDSPMVGLMSNIPASNIDQPHKHYAYALQWFVMGLVLAIVGGLNLFRSYKRG